MAGFLLRAENGTSVTPSLAVKLDEVEDGVCRLCASEVGTVQHILSGCDVALEQGRHTFRNKQTADDSSSFFRQHMGSTSC